MAYFLQPIEDFFNGPAIMPRDVPADKRNGNSGYWDDYALAAEPGSLTGGFDYDAITAVLDAGHEGNKVLIGSVFYIIVSFSKGGVLKKAPVNFRNLIHIDAFEAEFTDATLVGQALVDPYHVKYQLVANAESLVEFVVKTNEGLKDAENADIEIESDPVEVEFTEDNPVEEAAAGAATEEAPDA